MTDLNKARLAQFATEWTVLDPQGDFVEAVRLLNVLGRDYLGLLEQLEAVRKTLEQIAGPTPTSHRKTVDQLTDAVKWRQGMAKDALVRLGSNPATEPEGT